MATTHAWDELMWAEMGDLGTLLHELPDDEFDRPSLCEGWDVRDVVGHMLVGHTTPMPQMVTMLAKYRFNVPKGSYEQSRAFARALTPDEIRERWDDVVSHRTKKGIARVIRANEGYVDHTVHHQDIRRALDRPRTIPDERVVAALDGAAAVASPFFAPKKHAAGLRLEATDLDWTHGDGPEVRGTAEALLMAVSGRPVAVAELEGDGVATLAGRVGASAT